MKKIDMSNVQEATDFQRLPAGAYDCVIRSAEDRPDKEYLLITYDIAKGEYAGYYDDIRKNHPDWAVGTLYKSYKEKALPLFKRFCSSISKSNGNFVFDGNTVNSDEKTLVGKHVGLVLGEEEYYGNDGNKKVRLRVVRDCQLSELEKQKIPDIKRLDSSQDSAGVASGFVAVDPNADGELPF